MVFRHRSLIDGPSSQSVLLVEISTTRIDKEMGRVSGAHEVSDPALFIHSIEIPLGVKV